MRIAVSAQGCDLDSPVDSRFGRAQAFVIVDQATGEFTCLDNLNRDLPQSAGIQTAQMVADAGAQAIITGRVGPKAQTALQQAGLLIHFAAEGSTVRQAVEAFTKGSLPSGADPNPAMNQGYAPGPGMGPGMESGMGRGMGGCGGGGGGGGMGRGFGGGCRGGGRGRGMGMGGGGGRGMGGGRP